ncbi:MAG: hypothetical protein K6A65_07355, partial [Succinivibrionaceae bacterium]|nr:hypothetical protein [Succinivibrionaceae bacterium]
TALAAALKANPGAPLPDGVTLRQKVELQRGKAGSDERLLAAVFALPREGEFRSCVTTEGGVPTLAVLREVGRDDSLPADQYGPLVRSQLSQFMRERIDGMLCRSARAMNEISYDEDAIRLVEQTNAGER